MHNLRIFIPILLFFLIISFRSEAQEDLYDAENSKKFANFLYMSSEYSLAAEEYERVLFFSPDDEDVKINLLKSYRYSGQYKKGLMRIDELFPLKTNISNDVFMEYSRFLLTNNLIEESKKLTLIVNNVDQEYKDIVDVACCLYEYDWEEADRKMSSVLKTNEYYLPFSALISQGKEIKYKSPALSGALSAVVPGLGKVYSGYWKDGLIAFLFTSVSSWQSYRGFKKDGIKSPYGWIYGFMSVGFYVGNIYGSVKAANKYNYTKNHIISHEIEEIFINRP
jgi:tetratricopeptide (TPR) repeat protein